MEIGKKAEALLKLNLCDHCLGRQFAQLGHGLENHTRGKIIRKYSDELKEEHFDERPESEIGGNCTVCDGIYDELDRYAEMVKNSLDRYQLETFLLGVRPPVELIEKEEEIWEDYGVQYTEPIKTELSRLIGKKVGDLTGLSVEFKRPDIMAVIDMRDGKDRIELQVNSLLFYGRYNKYSRELPQTEWPCSDCGGSGCDSCEWTGQQYQGSVQEIVQKPFIEQTKGIDAKFHGAGREDIDVKCFGKRPFVVEIREPLHRDLDLDEIQAEINKDERIEVFDLEETHHNKPAEVKQLEADKSYRAHIEVDNLESVNLEVLKKLEGIVEQRTPSRVEHRRADKVREREVKEVSWEIEENILLLDVRAESGTYIKELISSDEGRTTPSVSGLLGQKAECIQLDVTGFHIPSDE